MPLPQVGDWVGFYPDKQKPEQWFWGLVVSREFYANRWRLLIDRGSGGFSDYYLDELFVPDMETFRKLTGKQKGKDRL